MDELFTVEQASANLHCSGRKLRELVAQKVIGHYRLCGRLYFSPADISNYIEQQHIKAGGAQ